MKFLFYINVIANGGAERVISNLASQFAEQGHTVFLVASYPCEKEYDYSSKIHRINLSQKRVDGFLRRNIIYIRELRKIIKKERPDCIVSFMADPNLRLLISSMFIKIKKVVSVRNDPQREYGNKIYRFLAKTLFLLADTVVIQTEDERKWFPKPIQKKCVVIMNQVKEVFFNTPHISSDYFVATGRLVEQKNYPLMISAFAEIVKEYKDEKLLIYGEGNQKEKLESLIKDLGMENNIFLMGRTMDMPQVLAHAKCFLLTSDYEGMPNGLLEAMTMGVPCISTDCPCGGPRTVIKNGVNGFLFLPNDKEILINCIEKIQCDPLLTCRFQKQAKITAKSFSPKIVSQEWKRILTVEQK